MGTRLIGFIDEFFRIVGVEEPVGLMIFTAAQSAYLASVSDAFGPAWIALDGRSSLPLDNRRGASRRPSTETVNTSWRERLRRLPARSLRAPFSSIVGAIPHLGGLIETLEP